MTYPMPQSDTQPLDAEFTNVLGQLIRRDGVSGATLTLTSSEHDVVLTGLERILVEDESLQAYLEQLEAACLPLPLKHRGTFSDEQTALILEQGLNVIREPGELAGLALNVTEVLRLRALLDDQDDISDHWWEVCCRYNSQLTEFEAAMTSKEAELAELFEEYEQARTASEVESNTSPPEIPASLEPPRPGIASDETAGPSAAAGETLLSPEARREQALRMLSEDHRRLIQWRDFDGLSSDEVAQRMGWTRKQVVDQLPNARVEFEEAFAKVGRDTLGAANPTPTTNASAR